MQRLSSTASLATVLPLAALRQGHFAPGNRAVLEVHNSRRVNPIAGNLYLSSGGFAQRGMREFAALPSARGFPRWKRVGAAWELASTFGTGVANVGAQSDGGLDRDQPGVPPRLPPRAGRPRSVAGLAPAVGPRIVTLGGRPGPHP